MTLKVGQRWGLRKTFVESCLDIICIFEVVKVKSISDIDGKVVYNPGTYCDYAIGRVTSCGSFPTDKTYNCYWIYLEGQDRPDETPI